MNDKVSVIIPSRNELYLQHTIEDIKAKFTGSYEIIVVLDGVDDKRIQGVKYIFNPSPKGMRTAINQGVAKANGKYLLKLDAHCLLDKSIDEKLKRVHQNNWVQTPRRKRFDPKTWSLIDLDKPDIDYMVIGKGFKGHKDNDKNRNPKYKKILLDDTEVFQGSCYFITKKFFTSMGLLDDVNFGKMGSEAIEICLKVRNAGGRVIINKTTWYAHARLGRRYTGSSQEMDKSREYIKVFAKQL